MSVSEKSLDLIKKNHIEPRPKWQFKLKNIVLWSLIILTVILSGLAIGVGIFILHDSDLDVYSKFGKDFLTALIENIPLFFVVLFGVLIVFVFNYFRNTKRGYRYSSTLIIIGAFIISFILGGLFFVTGAGETADRVFAQSIPAYNQIVKPRQEELWQHPELGLIAGEITSATRKEIKLTDLQGKEWTVNIEDTNARSKLAANLGSTVKIIGKETSSNTFTASEVRLWANRPILNFLQNLKERLNNRRISSK